MPVIRVEVPAGTPTGTGRVAADGQLTTGTFDRASPPGRDGHASPPPPGVGAATRTVTTSIPRYC